jgi:hypothetical protein
VTEKISTDAGPSGGTESTFEVVDLERLTEYQRHELAAGEEDPFDAAGNTLRWRPKDRHVTLRTPDGPLIAMWRRLRGETALPTGPVTVHSLPF